MSFWDLVLAGANILAIFALLPGLVGSIRKRQGFSVVTCGSFGILLAVMAVAVWNLGAPISTAALLVQSTLWGVLLVYTLRLKVEMQEEAAEREIRDMLPLKTCDRCECELPSGRRGLCHSCLSLAEVTER